MKKSHVNKLCTLVFIMGVADGILMHHHLQWHDVIGLVISSFVFYFLRILNVGNIIQRVLPINKKD